MKHRTATCLLLCTTAFAGCNSAPRISSWNRNESVRPLNQVERAESTSPTTASPSTTTPAPTQAQAQIQPATTTADSELQLGRQEIAQWNVDQQPGRLAKARSHFETALTMRPRDAQAHHGLATIADLEQNYSLAERHYMQALTLAPSSSEILGDLGYSYLLQNRLQESERYSQLAIQANPQNRQAIKHLGDAYARQGKTQLAQEMYARILSAPEVQQALAANSPASTISQNQTTTAQTSQSSSLIERLIPKSQGEKLTEEIRKKQQAYQEEQARRTAQAALRRPGSPYEEERLRRDAQLREQLAAIDREASGPPPQLANGPILLDNETRQVTRLPGGDANTWSQGANLPMSTTSTMMPLQEAPSYGPPRTGGVIEQASQQTSTPAQESAGTPEYASASQQTPGLQPWSGVPVPPNYERPVDHAYQQGIANSSQNSQQIVPAAGQVPSPPGSGYQAQPSSPPGGGNIYSSPAGDPRNAAGPAAMGQPAPNSSGQYPPQSSFPPAGGQIPNQGGTNPNQQQPWGPNSFPGQGNSYQQASQTAARLGMGLAPGSVFSQTPPVNPPGSMSYDQAGVPTPQRIMPDERPVQNLNQAYDPFSTQNPAPTSTLGGPPVPSAAPMYSRQQYNSPVRYDEQTMQNSNLPQPSWDAMKPYEAQLWAAGQQGNRPVQDVWAAGPINSAVSPTAGSQYSYPTSNGPTFTPNPPLNANNTRPAQWPHAPQAIPDASVIEAQRTGAAPTTFAQYMEQRDQNQQVTNGAGGPQQTHIQAQYQQPAQQQFNRDVTIPPAYRPNANGNGNYNPQVTPMNSTPAQQNGTGTLPNSQNYPSPNSSSTNSSPSNNASGLPMIRPR